MPAMTDQKFAEFFAVMTGIYGHKWVSQYGTDTDSISARVWRDGLASLEILQVASAVRHYKNQSIGAAWPPSVPEFRCEALGLPTLAAYRHAMVSKQVTPFTLLASRFVDSYRLRNSSAKEHDKLIEDAYKLAMEAIERGEELPVVHQAVERQPVPQYEERPKTPEEEARTREMIESARRMFA